MKGVVGMDCGCVCFSFVIMCIMGLFKAIICDMSKQHAKDNGEYYEP